MKSITHCCTPKLCIAMLTNSLNNKVKIFSNYLVKNISSMTLP